MGIYNLGIVHILRNINLKKYRVNYLDTKIDLLNIIMFCHKYLFILQHNFREKRCKIRVINHSTIDKFYEWMDRIE